MITGALGVGSVTGVGAWAIKLASDLEQTTVAFEVMTGSVEKANEVVNEMRQFGAVTPFESADLLNATKSLMAFGIEASQATEYVKMLSNVAMGDAFKLESVAMAFGKIKADGKLMGDQLNVLTNLGFNPLQVISDKTGESMASLRKKMEKGQISFQMVADAFKSVTSEGGRFYGMNERMSQTLAGKWSTLKDEAAMLATTIGEQMVPALKDMLEAVKPLMQAVGFLAEKWAAFNATPVGRAWNMFMTPQGLYKAITMGPEAGMKFIAGGQTDPFQDTVDGMPEVTAAIAKAEPKVVSFWERMSTAASRYLEWSKQIADKLEDMQKSADRLKESLRTPFEVARDGFIELNNLLTYGFIDPETFARGGIRLREELEEALKAQRGLKDMGNTGGVAALQRGTSGAFSAVQAAGREFRDMAARQMEQTKLQAEANTLLRQIRDQEGITVTEATI
jgi:tape measure domain-containing protein